MVVMAMFVVGMVVGYLLALWVFNADYRRRRKNLEQTPNERWKEERSKREGIQARASAVAQHKLDNWDWPVKK
jgi:predicted histidine transporter YuiF (NhaC family)